MVGTAVAGAVAVGAGTQVMNNEVQFSDDKDDYLERVKRHNAKEANFEADYVKAVKVIQDSCDEMQLKFMSRHFSDENNAMNADLLGVEVAVVIEPIDPEVASTLDRESVVDEVLPELEDDNNLLEQAISLISTGETEVDKGIDAPVRIPISVTSVSKSTGTKVTEVTDQLSDEAVVGTTMKQ